MTKPPAHRRRWLAAAALFGVAGLGNGWMWYRRQHPPNHPSPSTHDLPPDQLWTQTFPTLTGKDLDMADFRGQALVINFWATWCPPCVKELPLLNQFAQEMRPKNWRVIGLAIDQKAAVQKFLSHTPVQYDVAIARDNGISLALSMGNLAGGLPFSVVLDASGHIKTRKLGPLHASDLAFWATLANQG